MQTAALTAVRHGLAASGLVIQVLLSQSAGLLAHRDPDNASGVPAGQPSLPEETQPLAELLMPWNAA